MSAAMVALIGLCLAGYRWATGMVEAACPGDLCSTSATAANAAGNWSIASLGLMLTGIALTVALVVLFVVTIAQGLRSRTQCDRGVAVG